MGVADDDEMCVEGGVGSLGGSAAFGTGLRGMRGAEPAADCAVEML